MTPTTAGSILEDTCTNAQVKPGIHPNYVEVVVSCACGYTFKTRSTKPVIRLEICSNCHPFYTGKQKLVDSAGRVERFQKRFAKTGGAVLRKAKSTPKLLAIQKTLIKKSKLLTTAPKKVKKQPPSPASKNPENPK